MNLKCSSCQINSTNYPQLDIHLDINNICPNCGEGKLYFEGYCPDCHFKLKITENKQMYRCSNCKKLHTIDQILQTKP